MITYPSEKISQFVSVTAALAFCRLACEHRLAVGESQRWVSVLYVFSAHACATANNTRHCPIWLCDMAVTFLSLCFVLYTNSTSKTMAPLLDANQDSRLKNFIPITRTEASFTNATQEKIQAKKYATKYKNKIIHKGYCWIILWQQHTIGYHTFR